MWVIIPLSSTISVLPAAGEPCTVTAEAVEIVVTTPLLTIEKKNTQPSLAVFLSVTAARRPAGVWEETSVHLTWRATGFDSDGIPAPECTGAGDVLFKVKVFDFARRRPVRP